MKNATIKIIAKEKYNLVFNAYEVKSNSGYGNDIYIVILNADGENFACIDCRYIVGYNFEKVIKEHFDNWYGENLTSYEIILGE